MVKALFDTNILIDFLAGATEASDELARYEDPAISVVTWMEVMAGTPDAELDATRTFLDSFELVGVDKDIAEDAVEIRRRERLKLPDAIIWAAARRRGRLLVTRDTAAFPADDPGVRIPYKLSA